MLSRGFPSSAPYYGGQSVQQPKTFSWSEAP
jgi:hypothetical protein